MKQILQNLKTGEVTLPDLPVPKVSRGQILIQTKKSLVSLGTEKMLLEFGKASFIGKALAQPDKVKQVWNKLKTDGLTPTLDAVFRKLDTPLPLGYSNMGVVLEVGEGVQSLSPGDRVISNGPHAEVVCVPENLCAKVPDNVSDEEATFTVLGSIGLQGIRLLNPTLGETFVVQGLGLIGLLSVQILQAHGCRVIGLDLDPQKVALAKQFGAQAYDISQTDPIALLEQLTDGVGVDGVLICASTKSNGPIETAPKVCRKRGRVVLVGVVGLELNRTDFYQKEISFQVSCSYGPGRYDENYEKKGLDYPIGFVRWTEQRNFQAVLDLLHTGKLKVGPLIHQRTPFDESPSLYQQITEDPHGLGFILDYPQEKIEIKRRVTLSNVTQKKAPASVGMIGAGNFAGAQLISAFKKSGAKLSGIASKTGVSGHHQGEKWGFEFSTTDYQEFLRDDKINTVVITTRHSSHGNLALEALKAGKNVFVEKPLALSSSELDALETYFAEQAQQNKAVPHLMVGFNRRFSPLTQKAKAILGHYPGVKSFVMTVNAGHIPADHWTQDPEVGGGRLLGEGCHFIDLMRFLSGSEIEKSQIVYGDLKTKDTFSLILKFKNGDIGTLHYLSQGPKELPKEKLEIYFSQKALILDNFRSLQGFGLPEFSKMKLADQDKGHDEEIRQFIHGVEKAGESPIPLHEMFEVSRVAVELSMKG
jgi:predicted dehydrogenase/threonine dehydrogenase-like Zn-dependent dehydrogenase